jgi:hypothetical protein
LLFALFFKKEKVGADDNDNTNKLSKFNIKRFN